MTFPHSLFICNGQIRWQYFSCATSGAALSLAAFGWALILVVRISGFSFSGGGASINALPYRLHHLAEGSTLVKELKNVVHGEVAMQLIPSNMNMKLIKIWG